MKWLLALSIWAVPSLVLANTTGTVSIEVAYSSASMPSTSATQYNFPHDYDVAWTATMLVHSEVSPISAQFDMFCASATPALTGTQSYTFTFIKNGIAQPLQLTFNSGSGIYQCDTTDNFNVVPGDTYTLKSVPANTPSALNTLAWAWRQTALAANTSSVNANPNSTTVANSIKFVPFYGNTNPQASTTTVECVMPTSGTLHNMYTFDATNTTGAGAAVVISLLKNDTVTAIQSTYTASAIRATDTVNSVNVVQGDTVAYSIFSPVGGGSNEYNIGIEFDPNTEGQSVAIMDSVSGLAQNTTGYKSLGGSAVTWLNAQTAPPVLTLQSTLSNLYVASPGFTSAATGLFNLQDNYANTGMVVQLTGTGAGKPNEGGDLTHTYSASTGDLLELKGATSSATGTFAPTYGIVFSSGTRTISSALTKGYIYLQ